MARDLNFRIRSFADRDFPALRAMIDGLQEYECGIEPNRAHWADGGRAYAEWVLEEAAQNSGIVLVAVASDDAPIGILCAWQAEDATDITVTPAARLHLYVSELFILEPWRGRGVGQALLAEAEEHARRIGMAQITIGSLAANTAARRAYAKAGFDEYEILLRKMIPPRG